MPEGASEERVVKRGFDDDYWTNVGTFNNWQHPFFLVPQPAVKDAIDRRRRKLRDIEDGQVLVRDQLFRELPPRGREHKRPRRTGQ